MGSLIDAIKDVKKQETQEVINSTLIGIADGIDGVKSSYATKAERDVCDRIRDAITRMVI